MWSSFPYKMSWSFDEDRSILSNMQQRLPWLQLYKSINRYWAFRNSFQNENFNYMSNNQILIGENSEKYSVFNEWKINNLLIYESLAQEQLNIDYKRLDEE